MDRDKFIEHINERLSEYFTKDPEKDLWINERDVTVGGGVMVVNGRQMQQPGQQHHIKSTVELVGDGETKAVGSSDTMGFAMIDFSIQEDDGPVQSVCPTECIYYNESHYFDQLINKLFGI